MRHTVLYGHVIQLQHTESLQYLTSLGPAEGGADGGLALKLGLTPSCDLHSHTWFRVRPATEQRSDGEKVSGPSRGHETGRDGADGRHRDGRHRLATVVRRRENTDKHCSG